MRIFRSFCCNLFVISFEVYSLQYGYSVSLNFKTKHLEKENSTDVS